MAINDTEEFIARISYAGQEVLNTHHFRCLQASPPAGLTYEQALIDAWQAAAYTPYRALMTTAMTITTLSARQVCGSPPLRARVDETVSQGGTRTVATDAAAPWLASLVRERTAFAGRSYQGRNFYPIGMEGDFVTNALVAGYITLVDAYNTALMGAFGPSGTNADFRLVVHSAKLAAVPGAQCQESSTPVLSLSTSPYLTTMRSRRSRSGA